MNSSDNNKSQPLTASQTIKDPQTLDTRNHSFNVGIARDYSPTMALWLGHLAFWSEKNLANNENIHDGLVWSYDTIEAMNDYFPYLSKSQIETMINNSIKEGLVARSNYNQTKYDRTVWYALTPKAYFYFPHLVVEKYVKRLFSSISEKSEMDFTEFGNRFPGFRMTIPDTDPDTDPTTTTTEERPREAKVKPQEKHLSSSSVFSEKIDNELIDLRNQHLPPDKRTNEEFLKQCKHHVDSGDKKYSFTQKIAGLKKLLGKGCFEIPPGYKSQEQNKNNGLSEELMRSHYNNYYNSWVEQDLRSKGFESMTFEEWKKKTGY